MPLTPLTSLRASTHQIPAYSLPNTSILHKLLLIYHFAFPSSTSALAIEASGVIRCTRQPTSVVPCTKCLCISRGKAKLCFGDEENPLRVETEVTTGDVVVIPAGVDPACWRTWKGDLRWWITIRKTVVRRGEGWEDYGINDVNWKGRLIWRSFIAKLIINGWFRRFRETKIDSLETGNARILDICRGSVLIIFNNFKVESTEYLGW